MAAVRSPLPLVSMTQQLVEGVQDSGEVGNEFPIIIE